MAFPLLRLAYLLIGLWAALWIVRTLNELQIGHRANRTSLRDLEARLLVLEREREQRRIT